MNRNDTRFSARPSILTAVATLSLIAAAAVGGAQDAVRFDFERPPLDPSTWCPTGPTQDELRPGLSSSDPAVFNLGALEASFTVAGNGRYYLTLSAETPITVDNISVWDRGALFDPALSFPSDACYRDGDPSNPKTRVGVFDPSSAPGRMWFEGFDRTFDELKDAGWLFDNADIIASSSATEQVNMGDDASVTASCPAGTTCPSGTGFLQLGVDPGPSSVVIPVGGWADVAAQLQIWWTAAAGDDLHAVVSDFSPCPQAGAPTFGPPADEVELTILGADIDGGIDDDFGPIIDESDTSGDVVLGGTESFHLAQIDNDDTPRWGSQGRFVHTASSQTVDVKVDLFDADSFGDPPDHVDINDDPGTRTLEVTFDRCTLEVSGAVSGFSQAVLRSTGDPSSGDNVGTIAFKIETADGRPATAEDIAMSEVDVVQVVHRSRYLISGKPAVVMARIASNFSTTVDTQVRVDVSGPSGLIADRTFDVLGLEPGEVRKLYLFSDVPFIVPDPSPGTGGNTLFVNVVLDPAGIIRNQYVDPLDCRRANDFVSELEWKIVKTKDLDLTWLKVGRLIDASSLASDAEVDEIKRLGTSFIHGVYPVANVNSGTGISALYPFEIAGFDWLSTVAGAIGIPLDGVYPFLFVWHLNHSAGMYGYDKIMGVLPSSGWFAGFSYDLWANVSGLSLGSYAPHAVIFLPRKDIGTEIGPSLLLPAHELGHTFDLSVDRRLKDPVWCGINDPFGFGYLMCGATGGLDEYNAKDPHRARGNPATGFWIAQGGEDPAIVPLLNQEQCDRHCFMGSTSVNNHLDWAGRGRWIDTEDYEHLAEVLNVNPDPEIIYVSGMIDDSDQVFLGPWFRLPAGIPDRLDGDPGDYGIVFLDSVGGWLQSIGLPVHFGAADANGGLPVTFFGLNLPWPDGTEKIQIWRWDNQQLLAERTVSANPPEVVFTEPTQTATATWGDPVTLGWAGTDLDGDPLSFILSRWDPMTQSWGPLVGFTDESSLVLDTRALGLGQHQIRVSVTDGIHLSHSSPVIIEVTAPLPLFADDFESGATGAWSATVP